MFREIRALQVLGEIKSCLSPKVISYRIMGFMVMDLRGYYFRKEQYLYALHACGFAVGKNFLLAAAACVTFEPLGAVAAQRS